MINKDRIVPVQKIDFLSLIGTILAIHGTSYDVLASKDVEGTFEVLPVSKGEIQRIRDYIRKHRISEQKHIVPLATQYIDMTCPFRNNSERKCVIYAVRPEICRDFRCDKPKQKIEASKKLFRETRGVVSMRQTFFGTK